MIISNIIINIFINGLGENQASVNELVNELPIIALFLTTIFAPFIEEIIK